ncbi:MAG: Crp/Fnr family transcriptional regulator [Sphingomicrobium sp.]
MADAPERAQTNHLLAAIPKDELARIRPLLKDIELKFREDLYQSDEPTDHVWFPTLGVVSMVTEFMEGEPVEVATIGPEGMVGIQQFLGNDRMPIRAFIQVPGRALCMKADDFHTVVKENPGFERLLLRYTLALMNQISQAAACNRAHSVEERLARWLLMTQDRVHSPEFPLTQEFLGQMLGVRRPTVSIAAGMLSKAGLIHYVRGRITILDRAGLEKASCECYRVIADEFRRLVGAV